METIVTRIKGGLLVSEGNIQQSDLYLENGKIRDITRKALAADVEIDAGGLYVSAGFIDIHTHGANGYDYLDGTPEAFFEAAKMQAKGGATSVVATVTSSDTGSMLQAIRLMEQIKYTESGGADILGLHLEGPYFAMSQRGAQDPRHIRVFKKEEYSAILSSTDVVLRWSAAPELPGASEFAGFLTKKGVLPSIGHSDADSTCVRIAFQDGFTHVTHLYSGTSIVHRKNAFRYAGIVEAAYLIEPMTVEIIADGIHLPPDLLKLIYKIKGPERIALITDSMRGAGMPEGKSILGAKDGGLEVLIEDGVAKLPDRSAFAGSVALCNQLVRNMVRLADVPLEDAVRMASQTPAEIMGLKNKGVLRKGYDADIVLFDSDIQIIATIVNGKVVFRSPDLKLL